MVCVQENEMNELREAFACFDKDDSGSISAKEMGTVMKAMNLKFSAERLSDIVAAADVNGIETRALMFEFELLFEVMGKLTSTNFCS
jgi:Ca2+-binding EF-hand superfamily protein